MTSQFHIPKYQLQLTDDKKMFVIRNEHEQRKLEKTVGFKVGHLLTRIAVFPATSIAVSPAFANRLTQPVMEAF